MSSKSPETNYTSKPEINSSSQPEQLYRIKKDSTAPSAPIFGSIATVCGAIVLGAGVYGYIRNEFNENYFAHAMVIGTLCFGTGVGTIVGYMLGKEQFTPAYDAEKKISELEKKVSSE